METRNVNGDVLSSQVFEEKEELVQAFADKLEDNDVATISVVKERKMTDIRKKVINKQMRKLDRKFNLLEQDLKQG